MEYHRKGQAVPAQLKSNLANNTQNIESVKKRLKVFEMHIKKQITNIQTSLIDSKTRVKSIITQ